MMAIIQIEVEAAGGEVKSRSILLIAAAGPSRPGSKGTGLRASADDVCLGSSGSV
jgi:hypothetical protein